MEASGMQITARFAKQWNYTLSCRMRNCQPPFVGSTLTVIVLSLDVLQPNLQEVVNFILT